MNSIVTTVRLSTSEHERLVNFARHKWGRASNGAIIRQALLEFLDRHEEGEDKENGSRISKAQAAAL